MALANPLVGLSGIALIKSIFPSKPACTDCAIIASLLNEGIVLSVEPISVSLSFLISERIKKPRFSRILYFELEKPHNENIENKPRLTLRQTTDVPYGSAFKEKSTYSR